MPPVYRIQMPSGYVDYDVQAADGTPQARADAIAACVAWLESNRDMPPGWYAIGTVARVGGGTQPFTQVGRIHRPAPPGKASYLADPVAS